MKKAALIWIGLMVSLMAARAQDITVETSEKLNHDFSEYKTFALASHVSPENEESTFFANDPSMKSIIREAVQAELMGLGYEMDEENADLVVNFRVFEEPIQINGMDSYGGSAYWGNNIQYRDISDTTTYNLDAGTLMVSLIDRESGAIVWHGFASGLLDESNHMRKDPIAIREAVNMVFDEYGRRASDYSRR